MKRIGIIAVATVVGLWGVGLASRASDAQRAARPGVVATVGTLEVTRQDLDRRARAALDEFERRSGAPVPEQLAPVVRRQALEALIRANLLALEAQRRGVAVSDAEAEDWVRRDPVFHPDGKFSPRAFENARLNDPTTFQAAVRRAKMEIAARRLQEQLQRQAVADDAALRAAAERALSRSPIDVLALPRAEFVGDVPEPSEAAVIAAYRAFAAENRQPGRAVLSTIAVVSGGGNASDGTAKSRADSALAAIRGGASFDDVGAALGGVTRGVVVLEDNFPGSWRSTPRFNQDLFRRSPGQVLTEPVPTIHGWLLVRVDELAPPGPIPLRDVAREIRQELRREQRRTYEGRQVRALYDAMRDSLVRPGVRLRYAVVNPARLRAGEPTAQDLDRYYRGHQADYTRYDPGTGGLLVRTLDEVKDEIRARWNDERRQRMARAAAERIETAWRRGQRDRSAEAEAGGARDAGPIALGAAVDTTAVGRALGDTLATSANVGQTGIVPTPAGWAVYHVLETIARFTPPFEQVQPELTLLWQERQRDRDVVAARELFQRDPKRFAVGKAVFYSRLVVPVPETMTVPLTRAEVERYYRDHFDKYSAAEQVRARHILVSPTGPGAEPDRVARARAEELLKRVRAGEDFATLAREASDDVATKQDGGDLGYFGRGVMLDEVERAAFAMRPGDTSDLVRTSEGYHIIRVTDHLPLQAEPLKLVYANAGWDAAQEKAERLARRTADSLFQIVRTPAQARAVARKLGFNVESMQHMVGDRSGTLQSQASAERLERLAPGAFDPRIELLRGQGAILQWVDSIGPPSIRTWDQSARIVMAVYRREAGRRAIEAKMAELDSLARAGWSTDSLAALWGGWIHVDEYTRGKGLEGFGGATEVDSLVFGTASSPALESGRASMWVDLPDAAVRIRPGPRGRPTAAQIAQRAESDRRLLLEHRLQDAFKAMKQRFPVRIHDDTLRDVALPPLPPAPVL